jgi:hypothetical protein
MKTFEYIKTHPKKPVLKKSFGYGTPSQGIRRKVEGMIAHSGGWL